MPKKTWHDVERAAVHDPVLHAAVTVAHMGTLTREEALMAAAISLSEAHARLANKFVEATMRCTCGACTVVIREGM